MRAPSLVLALLVAAAISDSTAAAAVSTATAAARDREFVSPSTGVYASAAGPVGDVRLKERNVFDLSVPGENWWIFRVANVIHIETKPQVVRREILLDPGEPWDPLRALESERNLRATRFIKEAEIRPTPNPSTGRVDLDVRTQDSWTTQPQLNVGTEGGQNFFIWGLEEFNLLGYGKTASLFHSQVGPILRNEARYSDPRLLGSRTDLTTLYATTNRGDEVGTSVGRPFFSLESLYGWNALWGNIVREDTLYRNAAISSQFIQNYRTVSGNYGVRMSATRDPVQRLSFGALYEHDYFDPENATVGLLPSARRISGPVLGYSMIQPRYIKETYINKMERVEDFNLGNEFSVAAGAMTKSFGSDADEWTLSALDQQGLSLGPGRFALAQAGIDGRLHAGRPENAIFYANGNVFWKTVRVFPQTWVAHLEWNTTRNLDGEKQLLLGGNTGLRGYQSYSFVGTRSILLNFEDRAFLIHEFFHLFRAGAAAFFETGSAAGENAVLTWKEMKSDVGLGFRFASTRSSSGDVLRMDLAYALDRGPGGSRWVVSIRGGQAFDIFNSTNREVLRKPSATIGEDNAGLRLRER